MLKQSKNRQHGKVFISPAGRSLPFKHVFHVIISRMSSSSLELHLIYIQTAIKNVLQTVDNMKRRSEEISLALPMIGTGGLTDWRLQSCCNAASEAIWTYLKANSHSHIRHIHLVNDNAEITRILRDIFQRHEHREGPPSKVRDVPRTHSKEFEYHTKGLKLKETWKVQKMTDSSVDISKYFDKISNSSKDNEKRGKLKIYGDDEEQTFVSENCGICMCEMTDPVRLNRCKHTFCLECITGFFQTKPSCPVCGFVYGKIYGDQPDDGTASIYIDPTSLPGYDEKQTYVIIYEFPKGKQKSFHPDPGVEYEGFKRRAFLPISKDGTEVLQLLKRAFEQGMAFTIGTSRTTGKEGVITWNDIHHKTSKTGGPTKFGYPDSEYLTRVREELGCKGITDE
ncbi:deltex [Mytilus galloprovincialis]|uniref:E3 ubiquitin-protein ligase n=2 Tax=Mytilus galloprovincialis TaxID=29158 RepID=A0A8B6GZ00_MYTGA|nr:deltex [Mytilus galloprovincialis]